MHANVVLKWDWNEEYNNQMVLARKVPNTTTPDDVVERYYGKLYDGIVVKGELQAPPVCDPRFTLQVGSFPSF